MKNSIFDMHGQLYRDTAKASTDNAFTDHNYRPCRASLVDFYPAPARKYTASGLTTPVTGPGAIVIEPRGGGDKRQAMKRASI